MHTRMPRYLLCLLWCGLALLMLADSRRGAAADVRAEFDERLAAWEAWCVEQPPQALLTVGNEYRLLVGLGPRAAPLFAEQMQQMPVRQASALAEALGRVMGKVFPREAWPAGKYADPAARVALYTAWWTRGRRETAAHFAERYERWQAVKAGGDLLFSRDATTVRYDDAAKRIVTERAHDTTELLAVYDQLEAMGIDILPCVIERFTAGDYDLLPLFADMTRYEGRGAESVEDRAQAALEWWETNRAAWEVPAE